VARLRGDNMNRRSLRIAALAAVVLIAAMSAINADTQGIPVPDRRVLFDPAPMDQHPGRTRSSRDRQSAEAQPKNFFYRGLDLSSTDGPAGLNAPAVGQGSIEGRPLSPRGLRPLPGSFSLGIETERASTLTRISHE
jgi:hypothetical protein